ncbi:Nitrogen assimilation transcription factor nit-4 [Grifola frondosa]|uniref:Nitrogen assimilation transcription factor nit-4 n=1 Tax=Grifola frondosa TaxID=5627 RepID=A0A1C7M597_GRIFR|nr:Nitrogen assimilation transcription factor nit-4 [Grifola frondosa]
MLNKLAVTVGNERANVTEKRRSVGLFTLIVTPAVHLGKETAKKARTQQHFESLENYIRALESKVKDLQAEVEECRRSHGSAFGTGSTSTGVAGPSSFMLPQMASSSKMERGEDTMATEDTGSSNNESDIDHLISPTRHLVLQETDLELYGPTSIFRLAPERSSPSVGEMQQDNSEPPSSTYFDWARHLPPEVPLSRAEHDRILDILFKFFTSWGLRLVPELFLRDMHRTLSIPPNQPPPKTAHYSPMLHNAALALATAFSDDPLIRDVRYRELFARKAKSYIEAECQRPSISLVSALSTIASFHSTQGEQSLGYLYFGMSGRMSQALGLSIDCSPWVKSGLITHADMLDRNWAYWATFSQDICWSLYVGRDCCVAPPKATRPIPVPFVGSEIDQLPWYWAPCKMAAQPSYVVRTFDVSCDLMLIARRIMDFVNGLGPGFRREGVLQLDALTPEVDLTAASRPNALPHRLMLHLVYWWLFLLLHRPFYRRSKSSSAGQDIDHVKLCNRASDNIMLLLGIWQEKYSLRYLPITLVQVIFCAGTSFVLSAVQATSGPRLGRVALSSALSQAEQCIRYLLICGKSFECANRVATILSNVLQEQLKPRLLLRTLDSGSNIMLPSVHGSTTSGTSGSETGDSEYLQYPAPRSPTDSLSATLTSLDSLRERCRPPASPEWSPRDSFALAMAAPAGPHSQNPGQTQVPNVYGAETGGYPERPQDIEMDFSLGGMDLGIVGGSRCRTGQHWLDFLKLC